MDIKIHGTNYHRGSTLVVSKSKITDLSNDGNGVGRAGLQPLRGGLHLL